jgi:hypothetical protein
MPHRIKQQVRTAIDTPELRRAIRIMDNIHEAMELLAQISPPVLEALRDAFKEMAEDRTGARGDLKAAWFHYTQRRWTTPARANGKGFSVYTKTSSARDASSPQASFAACWAVG